MGTLPSSSPARPSRLRALLVEKNDPYRAGESASERTLFGPANRYQIGAVHTRFEAVSFFVWDLQEIAPDGGWAVIRQEPTPRAALHGLPGPHPTWPEQREVSGSYWQAHGDVEAAWREEVYARAAARLLPLGWTHGKHSEHALFIGASGRRTNWCVLRVAMQRGQPVLVVASSRWTDISGAIGKSETFEEGSFDSALECAERSRKELGIA